MSDSGYIDLRSDTVTRPTAAMRRAMADAEVGDDLFGDDPTVIRLQERVAALTGKQAALYLPTGTLCNQIAMHAFTRSGHAASRPSAWSPCPSEDRCIRCRSWSCPVRGPSCTGAAPPGGRPHHASARGAVGGHPAREQRAGRTCCH